MPVQETTIKPRTDTSNTIDKRWLQEQFAEMDGRSGFVLDKTATAEKVRAMMLAARVRPEDNEGSREIIVQREERD